MLHKIIKRVPGTIAIIGLIILFCAVGGMENFQISMGTGIPLAAVGLIGFAGGAYCAGWTF